MKQILKWLSMALVLAMLMGAAATVGVFASETDEATEIEETVEPALDTKITTAGVYQLFNSGRTGYTSGRYYPSAPDTFDNNGSDIYVENFGYSSNFREQLGLSFFVKNTITERVQISINAYDVDESMGETDYIYLVDETAGTSVRVGTLSGMDEEWNNTTFDIDPSLFTTGHVYHFMLDNVVEDWCVWVRTVAMSVSGTDYTETPGDTDVETGEGEGGEQPPVVTPPVTNISASVGIATNGSITADVTLYAPEETTYNVELKATHVGTNNQVASYFGTVTASPEGTVNTIYFTLEYGAPAGTYRLDGYVKDMTNGNIVKTVTTVAGYISFAVAYNANGGSQNIPMDYTAYYEGNTVTVLYDYIPSKAGYTFLGWATASNATTPEFVAGETVRITIVDSDITLYAVWQEIPPETEPVTEPETEPETEPVTEPVTTPESAGESDAENEVESDTGAGMETLPESETANGDIFDDGDDAIGCFASVGVGVSGMILMLTAGAVLLRRKEH